MKNPLFLELPTSQNKGDFLCLPVLERAYEAKNATGAYSQKTTGGEIVETILISFFAV